MSRGPWKPETRQRRVSSEMNNAQRTPAEGIEPWKDTRAEARAKAQAALEELRTSILWKVASQNRKDAQARHAPRYIGHPCPKHDNAERYTSTGHCVICAREIRDEVRGAPVKPRLDRKLRRKAARTLLLSNRPRLNFEQGVDAS